MLAGVVPGAKEEKWREERRNDKRKKQVLCTQSQNTDTHKHNN